MAVPSLSLHSLQNADDSSATTAAVVPNPTAKIVPFCNGNTKNKIRKPRKERDMTSTASSSSFRASSSSSYSPSCSRRERGLRLSHKRRNPRILIGGNRRYEIDVDSLALPLGMSIAAFVSQILDRKYIREEDLPVDHLSTICTMAVKESLTNVAGNKFDCFVQNFEKSFRSTLRTLRLLNTSSLKKSDALGLLDIRSSYCKPPSMSSNRKGCSICSSMEKDLQSEVELSTSKARGKLGMLEDLQEHKLINGSSLDQCENIYYSNTKCSSFEIPSISQSSVVFSGDCSATNDSESEAALPADTMPVSLVTLEHIQEKIQMDSVNKELVLHQQLAHASPGTLSSLTNKSIFNTFERSVIEQERSNKLKGLEIGLTMKKLQLKEKQLALRSDSNVLERCKIKMGISKASFKAEKFKNQLEDTRYAEFFTMCIDCLVAGLLIMSASLCYGAYIYSYKRITEATASCLPTTKESKSWWMPKSFASFNTGFHGIRCQVQVVSRMMFGIFMIMAIAYLLLQRSSSGQKMPVTFILLLLGVVCGAAGKFCVDTLGGDGFHWLFYWEVLCLLHLFSSLWTSKLFTILNGPITVSQEGKSNPIMPYWSRRTLFYATLLLFLPLLCGLMPFAGPREWKEHLFVLVMNHW
ncbi:hypothetical protein RJ641_010346 [Dillenia turbinata]|uniref:Protein CPR-5-like n=1 Tax=Dillenia turbinata TaxID=194707 RepID=A0AAN8V646_9MAGN